MCSIGWCQSREFLSVWCISTDLSLLLLLWQRQATQCPEGLTDQALGQQDLQVGSGQRSSLVGVGSIIVAKPAWGHQERGCHLWAIRPLPPCRQGLMEPRPVFLETVWTARQVQTSVLRLQLHPAPVREGQSGRPVRHRKPPAWLKITRCQWSDSGTSPFRQERGKCDGFGLLGLHCGLSW